MFALYTHRFCHNPQLFPPQNSAGDKTVIRGFFVLYMSLCAMKYSASWYGKIHKLTSDVSHEISLDGKYLSNQLVSKTNEYCTQPVSQASFFVTNRQ